MDQHPKVIINATQKEPLGGIITTQNWGQNYNSAFHSTKDPHNISSLNNIFLKKVISEMYTKRMTTKGIPEALTIVKKIKIL